MSPRNNAVRGLIGTAMSLCLIPEVNGFFFRTCPNCFVFFDIITETNEDCLVLYVVMAAGLRMKGASGEVFNTKQGA